ncbi:MAG: VWA domain-containing protein [Thermoanaerobaculia bacterium]
MSAAIDVLTNVQAIKGLETLRSNFGAPKLLLLTLGAAALLAVGHHLLQKRSRRRRETLVDPALAQRARLLPALPMRGVSLLLALLALLGVGAALARPRWGDRMEKAERRGADVVLLMDTSSSMRATDVSPSRFILARQAAASLLDRLAGDRVALVACEGEAQTLVPLTLDMAAAGLFLDALEPGIGAKPGTSLAAGLNTVAELFPGAAGGKSCVVISDGEDLEGGVDAAIEKARGEGIVVHTVFVGAQKGGGAPVPELDAAGRQTGYKSDDSGQAVLSKPNPDLLRKLASATGGTFSIVSPGKTDLDGVAAAIDRAARRPLTEVLVTNREERFQLPLGVAVAAIGLLLLGAGALPRFGAAARSARAARSAAGIVALVFFAAAGSAHAQPGPGGVAPALPQVTPTPEPPRGIVQKLAARPPFTTARSEAKAGKTALEQKKNAEAVEHFQKQLALKPDDPTGAYNLGSAFSRAGNEPEAIASLEKAKKSGKRDLAADAAYNAGETYFRAKKFPEAAQAFRDSLRARPGDPEASYNYELCLRRAEEEEKKKQQQPKPDPKKSPQDGGAKPTPTPGPSPTPSPGPGGEEKKKQEQKEKEEREFESKANMSREKADQLLKAIAQSDLEEQKKKIAEQKSKRRVSRDW